MFTALFVLYCYSSPHTIRGMKGIQGSDRQKTGVNEPSTLLLSVSCMANILTRLGYVFALSYGQYTRVVGV